MNAKTFDTLREIIYEKSGITLNDNKGALVSARIGKRMRELGIDDARKYVDVLLTDGNEDEMTHMLDAISTNVTSFFREGNHFDFIGAAFSQWLAEGQRSFRFWSAACSSGEEPYSLAMTLLDRLNGARADIKILATDISTKILQKSMQGVYSEDKIAAVPADYKNRFFTCHKTGDKKDYEVANETKGLVVFQRINLSKPPFPMHGPMDAIFCRNVMIYFDNSVRKILLEDCYRLLKPGGYLFVGHAESLTGLLSGFKPVKASIYVKN
jgi:chemotaxis protein methyltransferase CheR